jgi:hypothetical protein
MAVGLSWRCDFCGGGLEFVNGYVRCSDCHVSERSDPRLRAKAKESRRLVQERVEQALKKRHPTADNAWREE